MKTILSLAGLVLLLALGLVFASCEGGTGLEVGWDYQDMDHDGVRNGLDADVDGDGYLNGDDTYPLDSRYY